MIRKSKLILPTVFYRTFNLIKKNKVKKIKQLLKEKYILITLFNNKKFIIDIEDNGLSHDLLFNKKREEFATDYFLKSLSHNDIFFDIGANLGYYTILASDKVDKVIAIEPVSENINILNLNISLNSIKNVTVIKGAISDTDGKSNIYISHSKNLCSMVKDNKFIKDTYKYEEIKTYNLDTLINKLNIIPTYLKFDVEGYEYKILLGNKDFFIKNNVKIFFELHPDILGVRKTKEILNFLKKAGYKINYAIFEPWNAYYFFDSKLFKKLANKMFEILIGHKIGGFKISLDDLLQNKNFLNGDFSAIELFLSK